MKKYSKLFINILLLLILLSSCNSYKKMAYLQNLNNADTVFSKAKNSYRLQPADQLYVKVKSLDMSVNQLFNMDMGSSEMGMSSLNTMSGLYLMSYSIDFDGNINLPVFGKIKVGGLTVDQATTLLETKADEYIKEARVDIKLVSFKISVLGEVKTPGQQIIMSDQSSIYEVLAKAGDLTNYANRKKVFIIRSYEKDNKIITVDLTQRDLLSSSHFFLQPNDIIYVEPRRHMVFRLNLSDYSTIISTVTSSIALIVLISSLTN